MTEYHLAQLNIGTLTAPLDDPAISGFVEMLDPINALADSSPGFVWRYTTEDSNDATSARPLGEDVIINLSVWESIDALWHFTYRTEHLELLRRRREWFTALREHHLVLWWLPTGNLPSLDEAADRLALLREHGPTHRAFTFSTTFPPPDAQGNTSAHSTKAL